MRFKNETTILSRHNTTPNQRDLRMLIARLWQKKVHIFLVIMAFVSCFSGADVEAKPRKTKRQVKQHKSLPVESTALYADIVIEARTGRVIHATNASSLRHPASLTKMMTLYLTFQALESGNLQPNQSLSVSLHAAAQSPSKLGLRKGQTIRAQDAVMALVTQSANDAAVVLAEALGGTEQRFAEMMTQQARALGMRQTVFKNASGLPDPDQVTTARDMAMLGHALIYHYPKYYDYFGRSSFSYAGRVYHNHNRLMERYEGMDGIKTGYVRASGFNLVASAVRGDKRLIGVVFGGKSTLSRDNQMAQLLDQSFAANLSDQRTAQKEGDVEAQGDSSDVIDNQYIALPPKTSSQYAYNSVLDRHGETAQNSKDRHAYRYTASNWGIQIGAYSDLSAGQQVLFNITREMNPLLNRSDAVLQKVQTEEGGIVYRARFVGMEQATARSVCAYIVKKGHGCLVVAPEQTDGSS